MRVSFSGKRGSEEIHGCKGLILKRYLFLFFIALMILAGCAPKQVKIYDQDLQLRNNIVRTAVEMHGKPYRSGAKGPDAFDCSGFIYYVYKRWGIILPVNTEGLMKVGYSIGRYNIRPGDIVIFRIKKALHSGIMLNRNEFIHASSSRGVAIDNTEDPYWKKSIIGYRSVL